MSAMLTLLGILLLLVLGAMAWQHRRHLSARRERMQDLQPMWYGGDALHVATCLELADGADLLEELRALRAGMEAAGGTWVYAGKVVVQGQPSTQIGPVQWDAIAIAQYRSRADYERFASSPEAKELFARFARVYHQGFRRSAAANLLFPQIMLGRRVAQIVRREPPKLPFVRKEGPLFPDSERVEAELREIEGEFGRTPCLVLNLLKHGSAEEQAADREYTRVLLGSMAEGGYGPVHMGTAEAVDGSQEFNEVIVVYYPSTALFSSMITSEFFQGIVGDKQLGDTQSTITVPVLNGL